jgi:hypothetical protein
MCVPVSCGRNLFEGALGSPGFLTNKKNVVTKVIRTGAGVWVVLAHCAAHVGLRLVWETLGRCFPRHDSRALDVCS